MEEERLFLENRVEQLAAQMAALTQRVEQLAVRVESAGVKSSGTKGANEETGGDASEELLSWVGKSSLLPRLSTLCFLLVLALVLRTVTDGGLIDLQIGSILGMAYAASLMIMGWRRYERSNSLAPIFTICGAVLMFTIVVEAHSRFESLPSVPAYILLMLTGLGMAALSYLYRVPAPIAVGTLGMCLAGAAIDYPQPFFPYLGGVLFTANMLGYFTARAHKYSWLRWILLLVTAFMITLWAVKLGVALLNGGDMPSMLAPTLFLPLLAMFSLAYPLMAFFRIRYNGGGRSAKFDFTAPALSAAGSFELGRYVLFALGGNAIIFGLVGVFGGLAHLELARRLAKDGKAGARGANAFVFAGSLLMILALPIALDSLFYSLPFLSALALGAAILSERWESGAVRLTGYLIQIYSAVALAFLLLAAAPNAYAAGGTVATAVVACTGLFHYKRCRAVRPPAASVFFSRFDINDFSAVFLLLSSLLSAFFMLRLVAYQFLTFLLPAHAVGSAFSSSQSVIINLSAAVLMLFALAHGKKEVRNVAVLVTMIGAVKVFLYDLIGGMQGLPLVVSVFSFGMTTALESFGLTRWHRFVPEAFEAKESGL